jgi:hypothetical protein
VQVCETDQNWFYSFQVSRLQNVDLLIGDIPTNVSIPFILISPSIIPPWNKKVENYVELIFILQTLIFKFITMTID